ncbi:MAG: hypothetical protein MUQ10_01955, partial [Anaerolineae bacterium]|nr:hypothetical protein [Anaerolineae bacterium]
TVKLVNGISARLPVSFGEILSLVGYRWIHVPSAGSDSATLLTYWQVESRPTNSLKAFAHLINNLDGAVAQGDGLASPAFTWQVNDLIVQKHIFLLPENSSPGLFDTEVGVYDSVTGTRLMSGASDRLFLPTLEVTQ